MVFTNVTKPRSEFPQRGSKYYSKTLIKKSATLGANCTIVCGVTIGRYAAIAAGSVVTKDIPDFSMWMGNPAKFSYWIDKKMNKIIFHDSGMSTCGKFKLVNNKLEEL